MSAQPDLSKLTVGQFAERFRGEMIPLSNTFSYFCATAPLSEEDLKEYLQEPVAALPPSITSVLPKVSLMLVPYLESGAGDFVCTEKPPESRLSWASQLRVDKEEVLLFALQGQEVAEYHYRLYHLLARFMGDLWTSQAREQYSALVREELTARVHGEVDEESWRLKQELLRRQNTPRKDTKLFRDYARQSFIDTLTLYLHGICCDIDVETGPRQLRSRYLRKRLNLLNELYPPPAGYAVFAERGTS
jgi:hypothetical protein